MITSHPAGIDYRPATSADIDAVLALWRVAAENDARPHDDVTSVRQLLDRDAAALDLAVSDGRVVGSLVSGWDGWRAHLYRLAVHPDARRQGVAARLLARAHDRLVGLGATRLHAMVLEGNELGHAVWQASGFTPQLEWRRWVRATGEPAPLGTPPQRE